MVFQMTDSQQIDSIISDINIPHSHEILQPLGFSISTIVSVKCASIDISTNVFLKCTSTDLFTERVSANISTNIPTGVTVL